MPLGSFHSGIATARRTSPMARSRSRSLRSERKRTWNQGAALVGEDVGEAALGDPRPLGVVEDDLRDEGGVVELGRRADPVLQRQGDHVLGELGLDELLGLLAVLAHLRRALVLGASQCPRRGGRPLGLRRPGRGLGTELVLDLSDGLVEEGARPEDDLRRLAARQLPARAVLAARWHLALGRVARDAALEALHAQDVGGQRQLRDRLAHEHVDRLVAEALVQALGGGEARAAAAHERVGRRRRLQAQREDAAGQRQQTDGQPDQQRPPSGGAHDRPQQTRQPHLDRQGTRGGRRSVLVVRSAQRRRVAGD